MKSLPVTVPRHFSSRPPSAPPDVGRAIVGGPVPDRRGSVQVRVQRVAFEAGDRTNTTFLGDPDLRRTLDSEEPLHFFDLL